MSKLLHISGNIHKYIYESGPTKDIWIELSRAFTEYHLICRSDKNSFQNLEEGNMIQHRVPKLSNGMWSFIISSFWIIYIIPKFKITHILAQDAIIGGIAGVLFSKVYKIPIMIEVNSEDYLRWDKKFILGKLQKFVYQNATKIRVNNLRAKTFLEDTYCISTGVIKIPHRVNLNIFNKTKENYEIQSNISIISIGRFVWEKNYEWLIRTLGESKRDIKLTLVGGGELKDTYIKLASFYSNLDLTLIEWIDQKDLIDLIISHDIYVQCSVSESGPRTLYEAMALAMPIISSNVGIAPDLFHDATCGLLYKKDSKKMFIDILKELSNNMQLRRNLGSNANKKIKENYEWNHVFNLYRAEIKSMNF